MKLLKWMLIVVLIWNSFAHLSPTARAIIECESGFNPRAINKLTRVGEDVGYFQINTFYHLEKAKAMGLDIYNPKDNIAYGVWLLEKEGTRPWKASERCWKAKLEER